ncbi:hypothetical protein PY092_19015 [Muricauda sp. 334s03]|uniref:Uncharacterized protein n=1 Tax=Flagellimonas yonaguniensis TaxID=3031325 RepID=A0ABT5Y484_9FLAO|nr:hypothetical protein [[Muricauda] yonaguniensis]MDF0718261.1 hypothetical protein [[Muricauda] yonaguniensis]|tara:strand:+ start:2121 stop:2510 length:390 start_codon:yes stop_codon:yes gene_type:complete
MRWKWIFEKGMFWILIISFLIGNYFSENEIRELNKTVGWSYDYSNMWIITLYIVFGSWLIFIIGYGIAALLGKKTNLNLSMTHFIIFIATVVIGIVNDRFGPSILIVSTVSIFVFGANIYKTLKPSHNK